MKQLEPPEIAARLAALYQLRFGGRRTGRFRVSRKYLNKLSGRKRLSDQLLQDVADEIFERDFVFIDLESYFVLLDQKLFTGYRRVTGSAIDRLAETGLTQFDPASPTGRNDDGEN